MPVPWQRMQSIKVVFEVADWSNPPSYLSLCSRQGSLWEEGFKELRLLWKLERSAPSLQTLHESAHSSPLLVALSSPVAWGSPALARGGKGQTKNGASSTLSPTAFPPSSKFSSRGLLLPDTLRPPNNPQSMSLPTPCLGGCPIPVGVQGQVGSGLVGGIPAGG